MFCIHFCFYLGEVVKRKQTNHWLTNCHPHFILGFLAPQYPKKSSPRGICLVMNNISFEDQQLSNREGAQHDDEMMQALFEKLGFVVIVQRNMTMSMQQTFQYYGGKLDHSGYDMFVCIVSTHGNNGDEVYGTDGRPLRVKDIMAEFSSKRWS